MQLAAQRAWSPFGGITSLLCKLAIFQHHQLSVAIVVVHGHRRWHVDGRDAPHAAIGRWLCLHVATCRPAAGRPISGALDASSIVRRVVDGLFSRCAQRSLRSTPRTGR